MKALICEMPGGPEALRIAEIATPVPGEGQALVRVAYCTLNPLDVLIRQGRACWMAGGWPFTPGLEYSGLVEAVGPGVDRGLIGKPVISFSEFGGCAEYALAPANRVMPLDLALGWKVGTAWRTPTLTAWYLLNAAARLQSGETVLIHSAAGPVAIMATQIAHDMGARVIGLAGGADKIAFARPFGADILFDYSHDGWPEQVMRYTANAGADIIIDGNGGPAAARNHEAIATNGRLYHIGASSGTTPPQVAPSLLIAKSFSVGGFNLNSIPEATLPATERFLMERLANGQWKFPIGPVAPLAESAALHARFEARTIAGRALIEIGGEL